jgi:hypothetical protein
MEQEHYTYYGCALPKLSDNCMVIGATLQMKVMDENGGIAFHEFAIGLSPMEQLGMLESASDTVRSNLMNVNRRAK